MIWVLDTSALVRAYVPDGPVPVNLSTAFGQVESGESVLVAPELILAETGQVLRRKSDRGEMSQSEATELLDSVLELPIRTLSHRELISRSLDLATETGLTVYDALYLAAAERSSGILITADDALHAVAARKGLA